MNVSLSSKIMLPTHHGEFEVRHVRVHDEESKLFREGVALQSKSIHAEKTSPLMVRVQSSCLFSESFWATDCDCALQLKASLELIAAHGGTVLYFYEEGRGLGLETKFRAIELQQLKGFDTRKAFECLKVEVDGRSYDAAAAVIKKLHGDVEVLLLSNNPNKVAGLKAGGVNIVSEKNLLRGLENPDVMAYMKEKERVLGHSINTENSL